MAKSTQTPEITFGTGRTGKVVIWNNGEKGYTVKIEGPSYKDEQGNWKEGGFFHNHMPGIIHELERALRWLDWKTKSDNGEEIPF